MPNSSPPTEQIPAPAAITERVAKVKPAPAVEQPHPTDWAAAVTAPPATVLKHPAHPATGLNESGSLAAGPIAWTPMALEIAFTAEAWGAMTELIRAGHVRAALGQRW